ncbi:UNVERIFIED_CONTAM: hypothetical protein K2H54_050941 [Gekko kuhli]
MEGLAVMALITKDLVLIKVILVVHQTITWALSQKEGMIKTVVVLIMALREVPFEVAKIGAMLETVEACKTDEDLIQISMMILTDQMNFVMTSIQTSDLATVYVNLRDGEAHPKKTNGDVVVQALPFPLITENLMKERDGALIVDLLDLGMDGDLQMSDFLMILKMHGTGEEEMKGLYSVFNALRDGVFHRALNHPSATLVSEARESVLNFRRGTTSRHEGRGPRGRDSFPGPDDFVPEDKFDSSEENTRGRDHGVRARGRGTPRGARKGLLPTPDEFPHFEGSRMDGNRDPGSRQDHPPHDGHSPASRERSSSIQGMDMASLPPRKRPWHDGPGTSDHRDMDHIQGGPPEERGKGRGKSGPSQRMSKSGRSSSLDGEHHDGYHREESFGGPPGGSNPSRGGRSGSNWGRGSNMNSSQSRRGASRGGGRGR